MDFFGVDFSSLDELEGDNIEGFDIDDASTETETQAVSDDASDYEQGTPIEKSPDLLKVDEAGNTVETNNGYISYTGDVVVMDQRGDIKDTFELKVVDIEDIVVHRRVRKSREVSDLCRSIQSTGLLRPLIVAPTVTDGVYILIDGYRRLLACAKIGKRDIPVVINNKVSTPKLSILECMYNNYRDYTLRDKIDYIEVLEKEEGILNPSLIEYLLNMNSGEYSKLKDILSDNDDDIVTKMLDGLYTIDMAYRKLEQRRKKESVEEKENKKAAAVYDNAEETGVTAVENTGDEAYGDNLTDGMQKSLELNEASLDVDNSSIEDVKELMKEADKIPGYKAHKQDPKYRERLDPVLRKTVLARDKNTCRICEDISGQEYTEVLDVHHIKEVYLGGDDNIDNLLTACTVCHKLVHLYARGQLYIRPFEEMSEKEKTKFARIVKLGTKIRQDMAMKGMKKEELAKIDNADTIGRTKPGEGQIAG